MRWLKWAGGALAVLVLLAGGGVYALVAAIGSGSLTPRIAAAIEGATGRMATLGAVSLRPGLVPAVTVDGATLANLPGGSRPEMATIRRLDVQVALLPLLRGAVDIRAIAIEGADILLERTADGAPNWVFRAAPRPDGPAPEPGTARAPSPRRAVAIAAITLADSRITLPDPRLGTLTVTQARLTGFGGGGPVAFAGDVALHGVAGRLSAETGALPIAGDTPWPFRAALAVGANRITAEGRLGEPVALAAIVPEPAALRPLAEALARGATLPGALPPLEAAARLAPDMALSDLAVTVGPLDLGAAMPGLVVTRLAARAPAPGGPVEITLAATRAGLA
ncbi:AsmA family protein, partial [Roseomonas sp. CECT 9278]|uniref:AsmA family protein n=1 Tax=Roseomonas sp. CECT 9278 TaxID=2845823 RepID=UPI001E3F5008